MSVRTLRCPNGRSRNGTIRASQAAVEYCGVARGELLEARLTHSVIGAFYEVYTALGFGFYESIYGNALDIELKARGHHVAREVRCQMFYKNHVIGIQRIDRIVDHKVVIETKSTHELPRAALRQLRSYLKATGLAVGLLLHFGPVPRFYREVNRVTTTDPDSADQTAP